MSKRKIYLAGPIEDKAEGGREWRENVIDEYGNVFEFLNPLDWFDGSADDVCIVHSADEAPNAACEFELRHGGNVIHSDSGTTYVLSSHLVEKDKEHLDEADAVLARDEDVRSRGTPMEIMRTFMQNEVREMLSREHDSVRMEERMLGGTFTHVPVAVWYDDEPQLSPWIHEHADFVGSDVDDCILHLAANMGVGR